jgi:hypothetical protein
MLKIYYFITFFCDETSFSWRQKVKNPLRRAAKVKALPE